MNTLPQLRQLARSPSRLIFRHGETAPSAREPKDPGREERRLSMLIGGEDAGLAGAAVIVPWGFMRPNGVSRAVILEWWNGRLKAAFEIPFFGKKIVKDLSQIEGRGEFPAPGAADEPPEGRGGGPNVSTSCSGNDPRVGSCN